MNNQQFIAHFQTKLIEWFKHSGRKHLPWQQAVTPYKVWVSEVMLQQTQVSTVIPYFNRFMQYYPDVSALAQAPLDEVLHLWTGLGYYARARNLHKAANIIVKQHHGQFPTTYDAIIVLPGIGRSTAGAILSLGLKQAYPILDGNVKRILSRTHRITGHYSQTKTLNQLWLLAEQLTPKIDTQLYNQAMMDVGALLCSRTKPKCTQCPFTDICQAKLHQVIAQFPEKKPAKSKPQKFFDFIAILNTAQTHILLYQRPASGIWGNLWCLPQIQQIKNLGKTTKLTEPFKHQLTHYELIINTQQITLTNNQFANCQDGMQWYNILNPPAIGLPQPIVRILNKIKEQLHDPHGQLRQA